ncbi:Pilus assembly protein, PilO [Candidatus Methylomirabilis lanthanidiphila]|uniref:Pilus assembly protein, PilO n=1 Tax=Candidatus Methylomirabilis lanthanidiphila TaxID=2211376 RepID=A0A564ZGG4_9BACT|nr:type 4a pilus biogenesis protein PilO [Candidatus Methylomirabilis lanthanidiphila]VUZ84384.1 Pilus assembly protein, PilO [Candidatus Methylomirabilis lanthanidiphila]
MLTSSDLSAYTANIPQRQKIAIGVIFGAIVAIVYWQLFLQSAWTARSEAKSELLRLSAEAERTRQIASQRPRLEQDITRLQAQLERTVQQLPTEKEIPTLLKRVAGLGQEADLNVALFKPGTTVAKEFYTEVPVQLKIMGTYHNLGLLFERLGRLERIVNVADLTIRQAAKGQRTGDTIQAEFGVVTYTYSGAMGAKSGEAASASQ